VTGFEPAFNSDVSADAAFASEYSIDPSAANALHVGGVDCHGTSLIVVEIPSAKACDQSIPPDLQSILVVWSRLKPHIREAIVTLVHACLQLDEVRS